MSTTLRLSAHNVKRRSTPWDDYAVRLFREDPREEEYVYVDGEPGAYKLKTYDYAKLKLFFVSLLWRASESSRPFFEYVKIGPKHTRD